MLTITLIPESAAADVFAVKCCGGALSDQNLEIQFDREGRPLRFPLRPGIKTGPVAPRSK
ncbi:MAG: hypothetical protein QNI85_08820 [Desulfobacterales bacterium]|nr:hypothetical protein [Desulfobacterales bacterium]